MWVFVGGTLGAAVTLAFLRHWPGRSTALTLSVVSSLCLGAFYATVRHSDDLGAFVGFGVLATAASFIMAANECHDIPTTVADGLQLLRRVTSAMLLQAAVCVAFAAVGYLSIDSVVVLYYKMAAS
ncbi:hypothetical protein [Mycolicibacterium sp.]|uniref:hypothetical protein n=1 Tax=Mycolicibacterium sp. TaxID=2320850 RepID=UPI001A181476|nr:hypothetical protein [Mycolicibacterium sp.]MBJ7339077.1 hypothetical protein [Mycolicibacterium sp.]